MTLSDIAIRMRPVNRTAASAVSGGEHAPSKIPNEVCSPTPILMVKQPADAPKLIGVRFGSFTVIGWASAEVRPPAKNGGSAVWVCRCVCGNYALRTTKSVRNPKNDVDACDRCRHLDTLKRQDAIRRGVILPAAPAPDEPSVVPAPPTHAKAVNS